MPPGKQRAEGRGGNRLAGRTLELDLGDTGTVSLDVAEITDVPLVRGPVSVSGPVGVEVGSGRDAPVGVVTELADEEDQGLRPPGSASMGRVETIPSELGTNVLDVESSLGVGVHVLDLTRDGDGTSLLGLLERDHSLDGGVSLEDSDSLRVGVVSTAIGKRAE